MITIDIPGREQLNIEHIVLDYNGTIALDGALIDGVQMRIEKLLPHASIYVLTADTYGTVQAQCEPLGVKVEKFPREGAALCKLEVVKGLKGGVCAIGNGFNDIEMFDAAQLSIAVAEGEGVCAKLIPHADVMVMSITEALDLLIKPNRLRATLRS